MPFLTRALVLERAGGTPTLQEAELVDPVGDEVLVRISATGICHTDLAAAAGTLPMTFPAVLGHEAAGVVERVGPAVSRVRVGDPVVIAVTHHCGRCRRCARGYAPLCEERSVTRPRLSTAAGPVTQGFGTGTFATATVVRERSIVRVPGGIPPEVAAVTGCAVATGCGAVFRDARVPAGSSVLVVGCGGVGLSAVMAARVAGAAHIVAVDPRPSRRDEALAVGADLAFGPDSVELRAMTFDHSLESAGTLSAMELAMSCAGPAGEVTLMGLAQQDIRLAVPVLSMVLASQTIRGSNLGRLLPERDFPTYFELYASGRLPLDRLVGATFPLDNAFAALEMAAGGEATRVVLTP